MSGRPRILAIALLIGAVACVPPVEPDEQGAAPAPPAAAAALDEATAAYLATLPLACLDRPHAVPGGTGYLFDRSLALRMDYEDTRAFYGCFDWHSAVNSTWTLAEILERFPETRIAPLIVEKLEQHLRPETIAGELAYFEENPRFERPYGWAWLLALHGTLERSTRPEAAAWAEATAPLAERFAADLVPYLGALDYPERVGTHRNTAFALDLALEYAREIGNLDLETGIRERSVELYGADAACPLHFEPSASDFLSPCLEEAKLMSVVLEQDAFVEWLDGFMPAPDSAAFGTLAAEILLADGDAELDTGQVGAKSHLIGLAFTRAEGLERIAAALPGDDARVAVYRETAAVQAARGLEAMFEADYLGSHWLATFALRYFIHRP